MSSPGVHWLQDPRSRVYNFTPWLETIPKVSDFAFERLDGFVKSSHDEVRFMNYHVACFEFSIGNVAIAGTRGQDICWFDIFINGNLGPNIFLDIG